MVHLDRALKSAAEQKEQLQHKALKINSDLVDMVREMLSLGDCPTAWSLAASFS